MKTNGLVALVALVGLSLSSVAGYAQDAGASGEVKKIDEAAGKITLKHGPIKSLDMDEGMTMVFRVKDPAMLKSVKAGDKIKFDAEHENGQYIVTTIEKAK